MLGTDSVFSVLAADDSDRRVASRRALALGHTRVDNQLGSFLRGSVTKEEFEARLAAVRDDLDAHVASACEETGHTQPEYITASLIDHYRVDRRWQPRHAAPAFDASMQQPGVDQYGQPLPQQAEQAQPVDPAAMQQGMDPSMMQQPMMDPAQQQGVDPMQQQMLQQPQQQAWASANPSDQEDTSNKAVKCPECGGSGKTANGETCKKCGGKGEVRNFGDSMLDHVAGEATTCKACSGSGDCNNCNGNGCERCGGSGTCPKCGGDGMVKSAAENETGLGKPEPRMDKRKWTPTTVSDPDPGSKMHPVKEKDPLVPIIMTNRSEDGHELTEIGEQTTETVDLPAAGDTDHGFYDGGQTGPHTKTFPKGNQASPVTRIGI
jgi:hypothetical protein